MSILDRGRSSEVHWSKDYIEHLRIVHFALVAIAVTGIIIGSSTDLSELYAAQRELHHLSMFVTQLGKDDENARELSKKPYQRWIMFSYKDRTYVTNKPTQIAQLNTKDCFYAASTKGLPSGQMRGDLIHATTPAEFAKKWDFYRCVDLEVSPIASLGNSIVLLDQTVIPLRFMDAYGADLAKSGATFVKFDATFKWPEDEIERYFKTLEQRGVRFESDVTCPESNSSIQVQDVDEGYIENSIFRLPLKRCAKSVMKIDGQFMLNTMLSIPAMRCQGDFDKCFPAIAALSVEERDYNWAELSQWLDIEVSEAQSKQFEAFGIRPPAAGESYWFMLAILTVLLYFWLHLRQLSPKLTRADTGLDVAWIGLYVSPFAYGAVWMSVLMVPLISVCLLGLRTAHLHGHLVAFVAWQRVKLLYSCVVPSFICIVLSVQSCVWMRRLSLLASAARSEPDLT